MNKKTSTRVAILVAALAAAIGLMPTASASAAKPKLWCPKMAEPCYGSGEFPRAESLIVTPKILPTRARDRNGAEVWRSGSWLMY